MAAAGQVGDDRSASGAVRFESGDPGFCVDSPAMSLHHARLRRLSAAATLAAALLVLLLPVSAAAHSELQSSVPAAGTTVPSPFSGPVVMTFTESLAVGSKADLYGPGHQLVASATIDAGTMTIAPASPLAGGNYTVEWVSIADDGDLLRGTLAFTVAAAASPSISPTPAPSDRPSVEPSAESTSAPTAPVASASAPSPSPAPTDDAGGTGSDVILPIAIALIVAAAGAFYLVRRNRPA